MSTYECLRRFFDNTEGFVWFSIELKAHHVDVNLIFLNDNVDGTAFRRHASNSC